MKALTIILSVLIATFASTNSQAQKFGIRGGMNLSTVLNKDKDGKDSENYKMLPGFHAGGYFDIPFNEMVSLEPNILISTKGVKVDESVKDGPYLFRTKGTLRLTYLEIPLNLKFRFKAANAKIYGIAGPYFGIGISGKTDMERSSTYSNNIYNESEDINWGSDEEKDDYKRLDAGIAVGTGIEYKSFQMGISYYNGLANISSYTGDGRKVKNRVLAFTVGYTFGKGDN